jgi:hypothetical protein
MVERTSGRGRSVGFYRLDDSDSWLRLRLKMERRAGKVGAEGSVHKRSHATAA